jgi:hypothetical protein
MVAGSLDCKVPKPHFSFRRSKGAASVPARFARTTVVPNINLLVSRLFPCAMVTRSGKKIAMDQER